MSRAAAQRRRRWVTIAITTAWLALAMLAHAHVHADAHAATAHGHCSTCQWARGASSAVASVATLAAPRLAVAIVLAESQPAPRRVAPSQLHPRAPPTA